MRADAAMWSFLLPWKKRAPRPAYRIPEGTRVYAVGDVHGRADLLVALHREIVRDAARAGGRETPPRENLVVYLGDYIDRGALTRQAVDLLLAGPPEGFRAVHLRGNHEDLLLRFLDDPSALGAWLAVGGQTTLLSYRVAPPASGFSPEKARAARDALREALPEAHREFFRGLRASLRVGDYFFCHAGVRPGVPLEDQALEDLLWIREEFVYCREPFGARVVHGHSICPRPELRPHRIGLDTGAYATGTLTCAVLEGEGVRLLSSRPGLRPEPASRASAARARPAPSRCAAGPASRPLNP
ncbi:MAG: metallophosphoesterase family protein [Deferrisomatales bacterium]|nr:metallophosphoesterase family protein [Deferrisomatales bacterium]